MWNIVHKPCFNQALNLSYLAFRQHIQHDLCAKLESKAKRLAIGYHIDFPLGGHVVLEYFLLLFGERVGQCISGSDKLIQRLGALTVALDSARFRMLFMRRSHSI